MIKRSLLTIISLSLLLGSSVYSMEQDTKINFKIYGGEIVSCPRELCFFSTVIKNVIEDIAGVEESDDFIPLPNIAKDDWDLLCPLLKLIRDNKVQEIRDSLHEQYDLQDLVKLLHASNYLDVRKTVGDKDEIVLLELVAEEIAVRLSTEQNLNNFIANQKFLESLNLDRQQLPYELSNMLAQKVIARKPGCRERLLESCPVSQKALERHTGTGPFNQPGDKTVTASLDHTARIWNVETGQCLHILQGHTRGINSAKFNQSGDKIITASLDHTARIWNVETGQCLKVLRGHTDWVTSAAFNQSGDKIVTASWDKTARIWDVEKGECLKVLRGHTDRVFSAVFNQTGDKIVTASKDRTARIWDVETGQCLKVLRGHTEFVGSAAFNQSGDKVVTASYDATARIWDVETGQCLKVLEGHARWVTSAAFNQSGDKVVTASSLHTVRINWDLGMLLSCTQGLKYMILEQALLLVCWNEAQSKFFGDLNLRNSDYFQSIFESISNEHIRNIIKPRSFSRIFQRGFSRIGQNAFSRIFRGAREVWRLDRVLFGLGACFMAWPFRDIIKQRSFSGIVQTASSEPESFLIGALLMSCSISIQA